MSDELKNIKDRLQSLHDFITGLGDGYSAYNISSPYNGILHIKMSGVEVPQKTYLTSFKKGEGNDFKEFMEGYGLKETGRQFRDSAEKNLKKIVNFLNMDDGSFKDLKTAIEKAESSNYKNYYIPVPKEEDGYNYVVIKFSGNGKKPFHLKISYREKGMEGFKEGEAYTGEYFKEEGMQAYKEGGLEKIKFILEKESGLSKNACTSMTNNWAGRQGNNKNEGISFF